MNQLNAKNQYPTVVLWQLQVFMHCKRVHPFRQGNHFIIVSTKYDPLNLAVYDGKQVPERHVMAQLHPVVQTQVHSSANHS